MRKERSAANVRGFRMGLLVPRLMLAALALDGVLRFTSIDPLTFRAWEALKRFRPPGAAFEPERRYRNPRSYGDLAAMANLPALREYRAETFSTDALGFRNAPLRSVASIAAGDSFTVGSGVNDDETLAARLSQRLGCGIYNAGGIDVDPDRIRALARRLGIAGGLVIYEYQEDFDLPVRPSEATRRRQRALAALDPRIGTLVGRVRGWLTVSPLEIACQRALKRLQDDRWLPNSHALNVTRRTLSTGDTMLFLPASIRRFHEGRPVDPGYWVWLRSELARDSLELLVVLVPSKYTVYHRFLREGGETGGGSFLAELEASLRRSDVPVVNLTSVLTAHAEQALATGDTVYLLDDIHWNARGAAVASAALAERLSCPASGPPRVVADRSAASGKPGCAFQDRPDCRPAAAARSVRRGPE